MEKLKKVRVLTVKGRPWGVIVREYYDTPPNHYQSYFWVRLQDGVLLKDLGVNEIEEEHERIQAKCKHEFGTIDYDLKHRECIKCYLYIEV